MEDEGYGSEQGFQKKPVPKMNEEKQRQQNIKGLQGIVDTLTEDVVKALDIKQEKKRLTERLRMLRAQEIELKELVGDLKRTRDTLQQEVEKKRNEISAMQSNIGLLKSDRAKLSSERVSMQEHIKGLESEKAQMAVSLEKTNDMLVRLRRQIEAFDEEIKK